MPRDLMWRSIGKGMAMTQVIDPKTFWEAKILDWEASRYGNRAPSLAEKLVGRVSVSLRYRMELAARLLTPAVRGRALVELGCGSGLLAERLMEAGAASYRGVDISKAAIARARERVVSSPHAGRISFEVGSVSGLSPLGPAIVFSLGLFDWLGPEEIDHVFAMGREGSYFHAVAEKRFSLQQWIHRAYIHLAYGHRTGAYVPQYHTVAEIAERIARHALPPPNVYRDPRMSFGIFMSDLPLGS